MVFSRDWFACVAKDFGWPSSEAFTGAELSDFTGDVIVHAAPWPSSKRRTLRISSLIFSLRKLDACSGHCTLQRMPLTRLRSCTRYHAAVPISTNKTQQRAAAK